MRFDRPLPSLLCGRSQRLAATGQTQGQYFNMGDALIGTDGMSLYSMIAIGVVIVAAIAVIVWNLQRRGHMAFMRGGTNRQPRLAILDAAAVDARRRLVLIRRDNVEHLVMIGGPSDIVVERGINRSAARGGQQESAAAHGPGPAARPAKQKPPQPKAPPKPPASEPPASEPIATKPLNIPAPKTEEPPVPPKPPVAAEPKDKRPAPQPPAAAAKPKGEKPPVPASQILGGPAGPAAAAVAAIAATQTADTKKDEEAIAAELEDALEAARELVMPDPGPVPAPPPEEPPLVDVAAMPAKASPSIPDAAPENPSQPVSNDVPGPSPAITADDLIADFDKVLEAEISKSERDMIETKAPEVDEIAPVPEPEPAANTPSASLEDEMKKLLGDLTVKH